jgi:hypothetical protein
MHESIVFVVRIWPTGSHDEGFRASVRRVDREDVQMFTEPEELVRYLSASDGRRPTPATGSKVGGG